MTLQLITGVVGIGVDGWLILLESVLELGDVSMGEVILTQLIAAEVDRLDTPSVDGDPQLSVLMILVKEVGCIVSVSFRCALLVFECMAYWCQCWSTMCAKVKFTRIKIITRTQ